MASTRHAHTSPRGAPGILIAFGRMRIVLVCREPNMGIFEWVTLNACLAAAAAESVNANAIFVNDPQTHTKNKHKTHERVLVVSTKRETVARNLRSLHISIPDAIKTTNFLAYKQHSARCAARQSLRMPLSLAGDVYLETNIARLRIQ